MILLIHTADIENVFIALLRKGRFLAKKRFTARYQQSEKLLVGIEHMILRNKINLQEIKAIAVITGPGPFSALRIGVATANAFSWALKIKIIGIRLDEFKVIDELPAIIEQRLRRQKIGAIIEPFYDREPNITVKNN